MPKVPNGSCAKGLEAASEPGISIKTVEKHRQHLMEKLNIHDVAALTRYAISAGRRRRHPEYSKRHPVRREDRGPKRPYPYDFKWNLVFRG